MVYGEYHIIELT